MIRDRFQLARDRAALRCKCGGIGPNLMPRWWGTALPCGGFDPTTLDLGGYWRPNGSTTYAPSTWPGTASAGGSGGVTLQTVSPDYGGITMRAWDAGTAVNGFVPGHSDGAQQLYIGPTNNMEMTADANFSTFAAPKKLSGWALVMPVLGPIPPSVTGGTVFWVLDRTGGFPTVLNIACTGTSALIQIAPTGGGLVTAASNPATADDWNLIMYRYDGTSLEIAINEPPGTSPATIVSTSIDIAMPAEPLQMGLQNFALYISEQSFSGDILEAAMTKRDPVLTDAEFDNILCYARHRYDLPLVAVP